ncbi:MAG: CarD family transcriptional regulator [Bacilli bacterium]
MYNKGKFVVHKNEGVCIIDEISVNNFGSGDIKYYIMHKFFCRQNENCKIMLPILSCSQIRDVISPADADFIINNISDATYVWKKEDKRKKDTFVEVLFNGNSADIRDLLFTVSKVKADNANTKKGLPLTDKTVVNFVEKYIMEELAVALNRDITDVSTEVSKNLLLINKI